MTATQDRPPVAPHASAAIIIMVAAVAYLVSASLPFKGRLMVAIFLGTISALMLRPLPGGAIVLGGVMLTVLLGVLTPAQALGGYSNPTVWLLLSAFFIARSLIKTGFARRVALLLIRSMGGTTMGLGYSLAASDLVLAAIIPSTAARVGGVILPITQSLAGIYKSLPGPTAALLGTYLMLTIYQTDMVVCAMFFTGQAGNPLAADLAFKTAKVQMNWSSWLWTALLPGLVGFAAIPWFVSKLSPPGIRHTPKAAELASHELKELGPLSRPEKMVLFVFVLVSGLWATSAIHGIQAVTIALLGVIVLLVSNVLTWTDITKESGGWDVFIWYGGLVRMGEALNDAGATSLFAQWVAGNFGNLGWPLLMAVIVPLYFYAHYAFASITTHIVAMYAPFLAVLIAAGAPPALTAYFIAFVSNLSAGLTHYGTTHSPMIFATHYVSQGLWWKVGLFASFVNLAIWTLVGLTWWKILGLW
ncbi:MAG: DASS family sodium-coupled anion symporter [Acidobacteria bacterium]|nr:DASS family sodium-coupled anion symporter [Acidobacteriota bacterium]